jgi:hypothetical protein
MADSDRPKGPEVNYEVENPEIEQLLRGLARTLKGKMPPGWGFSLFICSFGGGGSSFYISSMERQSFLESLQEFMVREGYVYVSGPVGKSKSTS